MSTELNKNYVNTSIQKQKLISRSKGVVRTSISKNNVWYYTLLILLIKSILFLGFIPNSNASKLEFSIAFFGQPHYIVFACFIISIISISYLLNGRNQLWFLIITNIIISLLIIADLWYYRGFGNFLSLHQLKQTANLENLGGSVLSMFRYVDIIFIIDIVFIVVIGFFNKKLYKEKKRNIKLAIALIGLSISYISIAHYKVDIIEKGEKDILFRICWTPNQTMANLSPLGYHIYDSYVYYKENLPYVLTEDEKKEIQSWFSNKMENLEPNKYKGIFKDKNLIFIQVESLENFVIKQSINGQEITPNINKLLGNSIYFPNFYEQVNNGTSSDADLLANTSVYPVRRGSTFFRYPDNSYNSLPKLLKEKGYDTVAIHPDKGSYWNWMPALTSFGFSKTIDSEQFQMDEIIGLGLSDGSYLRQVEPIIKELREPFYSFMVTLTSHGPFDLPEQYRELNLDESLDKTYMGGYFQSLHYTDKQIGLFLSKMEDDGLLENTVVVLYGDHTGVHKYYSDDVAKINPSEDWWENNNLRIPLLIYSKGYEGETINTKGGHIDILPTIAYTMGIDGEEYESTAMGRNLLNTKRDFAVLADKTLIGGEGMTEQEKQDTVRGIDLADKIIQSNYFNIK